MCRCCRTRGTRTSSPVVLSSALVIPPWWAPTVRLLLMNVEAALWCKPGPNHTAFRTPDTPPDAEVLPQSCNRSEGKDGAGPWLGLKLDTVLTFAGYNPRREEHESGKAAHRKRRSTTLKRIVADLQRLGLFITKHRGNIHLNAPALIGLEFSQPDPQYRRTWPLAVRLSATMVDAAIQYRPLLSHQLEQDGKAHPIRPPKRKATRRSKSGKGLERASVGEVVPSRGPKSTRSPRGRPNKSSQKG